MYGTIVSQIIEMEIYAIDNISGSQYSCTFGGLAMKMTILIDSTADLNREIQLARQIEIIPMWVNLNGKLYRDGIELNQQLLFSEVEKIGLLPTTAAPSVGEFIEFFRAHRQTLYISISSKLSAAYQNACLAVRELGNPDLRVIDSHNLSSGISLLALKAADMRDQGASLDQIEATINGSIPLVRTAFILETLDYIYKGGRCNAIQALASSILKIRPLIFVQTDGTLAVGEKTRGKRNRALQVLLDRFQADLKNMDLRRVFVTHARCEEDAMFLAKEVERMASPQELIVSEAGSVISSHCGPGTVGILYLLRN